MQKKLLALLGIVMALSLVLAACQPTETTQPTPETIIETVIVTEEVIVTEVVTEIVTEIVEVEAPIERYGGWLDTLILVADPSVESAVARLLADDIDVYAQTSTNASAFQTVKDEGLAYVSSVGSFNEVTLNPAGPELNDGTINPFAVPAIRKALNWIIDRDYIIQEIAGGLGLPKYTNLASVFPDYARYAATVRAIEADLAYNPERADEVITTEMEALGAEKVDGVWTYNDEPVTLIFLIRIEDERRQIGDYVSNQLETVGFTVDRQYKTSSEASPLWVRGDPNDGLWHLYTGGWISTAISRDDGSDFQFFYSPRSVYGFSPLWQNYVITDEMDAAWQALYNNDFTTMEERAELFRNCT
jgi:peptide/nickel transport system substrate-binding protein